MDFVEGDGQWERGKGVKCRLSVFPKTKSLECFFQQEYAVHITQLFKEQKNAAFEILLKEKLPYHQDLVH